MQKIVAPTLFHFLSKLELTSFFRFLGVGGLICLVACASDPPLEEYTLADTALTAARNVKAEKYAPAYWYRAQTSFDSAQVLFRAKDYDDAADEFRKAREYAEQAENAAKLNQLRSGDGAL